MSLATIIGSILAFCALSDASLAANSRFRRDGNSSVQILNWYSPEYTWLFQYPLPIPPVKSSKLTYTNSTTKDVIDYYEVTIESFEHQVYPNLSATKLVGYDGMSPGPTFIMQKGREAVVRFINQSPDENSVHVHGQYDRAPFDGWAADTTQPGQYKDYYYPNAQNARTLWYHDHAEYITSENAYKGQEGYYIITDEEEQSLGLPSGRYDIMLAIAAKYYKSDGQLDYNTQNNTGLWGDVIHVNGQPWPYLNVEPRQYRIRLLEASISRTYHISLNVDGTSGQPIPFNVIGSDAGLLSHPVQTNDLLMAMGERWEIVVDFSSYKGKNITMNNGRGIFEGLEYPQTDKIMRFVVSDTVSDSSNTGDLPSTLRNVPWPPNTRTANKSFSFARGDNGDWLINGVGFADVENRILAKPPRGSVEIWEMKNEGGGGTHPIHIHLIDFQILSRTGGRGTVLPYEAAGMKDIVYLEAGETARVIARYAPWDGIYMFHCHNLVHEDHDMLVAFNVTQLQNWGYDNSTQFIDPMEPEFRPRDTNAADFTTDSIMKKLDWFYNTNAYDDGKGDKVETLLDAYWAAGGNSSVGGSSSSPSTTAASAGTTFTTSIASRTGNSTVKATSIAIKTGYYA